MIDDWIAIACTGCDHENQVALPDLILSKQLACEACGQRLAEPTEWASPPFDALPESRA